MKTNTTIDRLNIQLNIKQLALVMGTVATLSACNSSNQDNVDVSAIQVMPVTDSKLVNATEAQVQQTLQNGLFLTASGQLSGGTCSQCEFVTLDATAESSSSNYSQTTTQEQNVDESDRVKYDGDTLYVASNSTVHVSWMLEQEQNEVMAAHVRVLGRNVDDSLTELATITADENAGQLSDLYLHNDVLTMIYNTYQPSDNATTQGAIAADIGYFPYSTQMGINFQNVEVKNQPQQLAKFVIDGNLISSRRIGNKVYLVSRYYPELPEQVDVPAGSTESELKQLYQQISNTSLEQVLPKIYSETGNAESLVSADECYIPEQHESHYGYSAITTVTTFDLTAPSQFSSSCIIAPLDGFYSSADNMYLYEKQYDESEQSYNTVIHKFSYQGIGVKYLATGMIPGHVSWNNAHLRFSEKDNHLRVVTSQEDWLQENTTRTHRLFVLTDNEQQELEVLAQLPNDDRPAAIGKPDEDIYAVRYFSDKAYVVTFRQTDPLYVINLADPSSPYIEGELEIPGYSGYLQPINDRFVLGIGQQIDPNAQPGQVEVSDPTSEFIEGAKAELYDVSDPSNPKVAATLVYEGVYSVAEWDYRALTQLKVTDDKYKFAFPLGGWIETVDEQQVSEWSYTQSMQLIELDVSEQGSLKNVGSLSPKTDYYGQWGDRAVLHDELVYYIRNNQVWQSYWHSTETINGPY